MNKGIERRRRLERSLAEIALNRYGLQGSSIELLRQRFVQVFRVTSTRGEFVLRLYSLPRSEGAATSSTAVLRTGVKLRSPEVLRSQLQWLSALGRETDLIVPAPVPTDTGSLFGRVSAEELDLRSSPKMARNFVLLRWVPGNQKRGEDLHPEDLSMIGSYVARLHRHAEGYEISEGAAFPRWDWEWPFGDSANLWSKGPSFYSAGDMEAFRTAARRVQEDLEELGTHSDVFGVIHRDLITDNFVFGGRSVGAFDFDLCGFGYYFFDLYMIRRSLIANHPDRLEALWAAFREGYERERPMLENQQRYLKTFAVMYVVSAVNRQLALLGPENAEQRSQSSSLLLSLARWIKDSTQR